MTVGVFEEGDVGSICHSDFSEFESFRFKLFDLDGESVDMYSKVGPVASGGGGTAGEPGLWTSSSNPLPMRAHEVTVSCKVSTMPYESLGVTYTQEFNDDFKPHDEGFKMVSEKVDEWITLSACRVGVKNFELKESYLDLSDEPRDRRRFR